MLDWEDIIIHAVVAIVITGIMVLLGVHGLIAAVLNAAFWGTRETIQDIKKGHARPWPLRWSSQKWAEFIAPAVTGTVTAALMHGGMATAHAAEWRYAIAMAVRPDATIDMIVEGKARKGRLAFIERVTDTKVAKAILQKYGGVGVFLDRERVVFKHLNNRDVNLTLVCAGVAEPKESAPFEYLLCWAQHKVKDVELD